MNSSGILSLLTSKTALAVIAVTLFWVSADVSERLFQHRQQNSHNANGIDVQTIVLPSVTAKTITEIKQRYETYRTASTIKAPDNISMSAEEQAKQTGELKTVFIGNKKLELKAVLSIDNAVESAVGKIHNQNQSEKNSQSVLLQVTDIENNTSVIEKFSNLDSVYGFQLSVISNIQVQLTKQNNDQLQQILLTMYKPST